MSILSLKTIDDWSQFYIKHKLHFKVLRKYIINQYNINNLKSFSVIYLLMIIKFRYFKRLRSTLYKFLE